VSTTAITITLLMIGFIITDLIAIMFGMKIDAHLSEILSNRGAA
jgi:hypothetical protein